MRCERGQHAVAVGFRGETDGRSQPRHEMSGLDVAGLTTQPHVDAERQQPVLFDRLRQRRGLAESSTCLHHGDPLIEALVQHPLHPPAQHGAVDLGRSGAEGAIAHVQLIGRGGSEARA